MNLKHAILPIALATTSCGSAAGTGGGDQADSVSTLVATAASFQGFRGWPSVAATAPNGMTDGIDPSQPRTAYINRRPPHGSSTFPTGTLIVKEFDGPPALADRRVFAMVKRGGGYNENGATEWEWFELKNVDDANVQVVWRGVSPPAGDAYSPGSMTCNDCHRGANANDFVWSTTLTLSSF
jgi:hypothetical protein